jgi:membrane protease YdiL (CAAX protease family)
VDVAVRSNQRLGAWLAIVALFASLAYAGNLAEEGDPGEPLYEPEFFFASVFGFAFLAGAAFLVAVRLDKRVAFALRRPRSWPKAVGISFLVFVGVLLVGGILGIFVDPAEEQGLLPESWPPPDVAVFALNGAAVVLGAALAEELLFRGIGYTLLERFGTPFAVVASAAAWAAAHGLVEGFPLIFAFGIGLGLLRRFSGSVVPCLVLHAVFNAFALGAAAVSSAS